jgi:hypothetical protein
VLITLVETIAGRRSAAASQARLAASAGRS